METRDYENHVGRLAPARRAVFDAIREHGPLTDEAIERLTGRPGRTVRPRRVELVKLGFIRRTNPDDKGRKAGVWEVVPPENVERAREAAHAAGPRTRKLKDLPVETRVNFFLQLARDRQVQAVIAESQEPGAQKARARLRDILRRDDRVRREQLRAAEREQKTLVDFLKTRNALKKQAEIVRATLEFLHEELAREETSGASAIPGGFWEQIPVLLVELIEAAEEAYEDIARRTGHPSRRHADVELDEADVIEGELAELVAAEDVTRDN